MNYFTSIKGLSYTMNKIKNYIVATNYVNLILMIVIYLFIWLLFIAGFDYYPLLEQHAKTQKY